MVLTRRWYQFTNRLVSTGLVSFTQEDGGIGSDGEPGDQATTVLSLDDTTGANGDLARSGRCAPQGAPVAMAGTRAGVHEFIIDRYLPFADHLPGMRLRPEAQDQLQATGTGRVMICRPVADQQTQAARGTGASERAGIRNDKPPRFHARCG